MVCAGSPVNKECPDKKSLEQAEALPIQSVLVRIAENRLPSYHPHLSPASGEGFFWILRRVLFAA